VIGNGATELRGEGEGGECIDDSTHIKYRRGDGEGKRLGAPILSDTTCIHSGDYNGALPTQHKI